MFINRQIRNSQTNSNYYRFLSSLTNHNYLHQSSSEEDESSSTSSSHSSSSSSMEIYSESSLSSSSSSTSSTSSSSSSTSSSSSSSSFGYCNPIIGAERFSITDYNGTYSVAGQYDGKPYWQNENGKYLFYTTGGNFWCMAASLGGLTIYRASDDVLCPYGNQCANWETWPGGSSAGIVCELEMSSSSSSTSSTSSSTSSSSESGGGIGTMTIGSTFIVG